MHASCGGGFVLEGPEASDSECSGASSDEEEPAHAASRVLCQSLAAAVDFRQALGEPEEMAARLAALPGSPCALCLALAGEDGSDLLRLPVMEQEHLTFLPAAPRQAMQPGSAAWRCWTSHRRLLWCSQDGETPGFDDWAALVASDPSYRALLTVPLAAAPGKRETLGASTFVLAAAPSAADEDALQDFAECLAGSIAHTSKHVWEESLGCLQQVVPRRIRGRMLIALSQGPVAAADAAPGAAGAASSAGGLSTPAVGMGAGLLTGEESLGPHTPCCSFDATGCRLLGWQASDHTPRACTSGCTSSSEGRDISESMRFVGRPGACTSEDAGFPAKAAERSGSAGSKGRQMVPAEVHPARQKWDLEFTDPALEASFKHWFNCLQTNADLEVLRYLVVLLLLLAAGLCAHGGPSWGVLLAVSQGLLSVAAMAALMLFDTGRCIAHRSAVVAALRITGTAVQLAHRYLDPAFYSDSLLKDLVGNCSLTLMVNSFRSRLRFSNHLLVQLAKLYLCSLANAFIYSSPSRAACAYLSLPATSFIQLAAALLPSAAVYHFEAALRRKFAAGACMPQARLAAEVAPSAC